MITKDDALQLPVDIVFAPDWWAYHTGITFDKDFFYHPVRRVEVERRMEKELYDHLGKYGLGVDRKEDRPEIGAVHLAAGYLISEMLGCEVEYQESQPPQVNQAGLSEPVLPAHDPFESTAWKRQEKLMDSLQDRYGYLTGDVNWGGILNIALDLRGQDLFLDMLDVPEKVSAFFSDIALVIEEFSRRISSRTGTTSISVNRCVRHRPGAVHLHSQCSHTMISVDDYRKYLMEFDIKWSLEDRPYGIHFCGKDPHRFAEVFGELPKLDFLDVGWGGDLAELRSHLPNTFLNIRMDPVSLCTMPAETVREEILRRVSASDDSELTGVCCINMDRNVPDHIVTTIFETAEECRRNMKKG